MHIKAYTLDSFAKAPGGGNPAGVVPDAGALTARQMQHIAAVIGFSETAFVMPSDKADFRVRFFTPTEEVDLCGHATIGAFFAMAETGILKPGRYTQETGAGVLAVEVGTDHRVLMDQALPEFFGTVPAEAVAESLGLEVSDLMESLPVQMVSTGLKDILVPVKSLEVLNRMKPDMERITAVSKAFDAVGYHVFTLETLHGGTAHCRNFAPLFGIPEESATGTSNGALAAYLFKHGAVTAERAKNLVMEQGYSMGMPSEICAALEVADCSILRVQVGGRAMNLTEREMEI